MSGESTFAFSSVCGRLSCVGVCVGEEDGGGACVGVLMYLKLDCLPFIGSQIWPNPYLLPCA